MALTKPELSVCLTGNAKNKAYSTYMEHIATMLQFTSSSMHNNCILIMHERVLVDVNILFSHFINGDTFCCNKK